MIHGQSRREGLERRKGSLKGKEELGKGERDAHGSNKTEELKRKRENEDGKECKMGVKV